jgi:hypothetical protein
VHPYTGAEDVAAEPTEIGWALENPCGEGWVIDIGIEDANHYVTSSGLVNKNCMDELTHFEEHHYRYLRGRCRIGSLKIDPSFVGRLPRIVCGTNPGGIGHHFVKRTFIRLGPMRPVKMPAKEGGMIRIFIPAKLQDNPALLLNDPDYEDRLEALGDPVLVRAMKEGDWDVVAGAMFGDTWRRTRHVCEPFPIPSDWEIWRGADDGFAAPAACYWLTQDRKLKTYYVIDEIYKPKMLPDEYAERVLKKDKGIERIASGEVYHNEETLDGLMDDQAFADTGQGPITRGDQIVKLGAKFRPVEKWAGSRVARVQNLHRLLAPNKLDPEGRPGIIFFDRCKKAIETIPTLPRDEKRIEDVDCLVAGTLIATDIGWEAIETIEAGRLVWTPIGMRRVKRSYESGYADTWTAAGLTGTANHPVFVAGRGMVPLSQACGLTLTGQTINVDSWSRSSNSTASSFDGTAARLTTRQAEPTFLEALNSFIARYGKRLTGQSHQDTTFITMTTAWKIWCSCAKATTSDSICRNDWLKVATCTSDWPHGGNRQRERQFFERTLEKCLSELPSATWRALIVEVLLRPDTRTRNSAAPAALIWRGTETAFSPVQFAEMPSRSGQAKEQRKRVATNADGRCGGEAVYNLTIEGAGMFYANGILSSNTDAEDHCFVAGTMVMTPSGERPIEDIKTGDLVMTRWGAYPVATNWITRQVPVVTRRGLTGTLTHPVWTREGYLPLALLTPEDTVCAWPEWKQLLTRGCASGAILIHPGEKIGSITSLAQMLESEASRLCTARFTRIITDQFQREATSTTRRTLATMISRTWFASRQQSTPRSTSKSGGPSCSRTSRKLKRRLLSGIDRRLAELGTESTQSGQMQPWQRDLLCADSVAWNSRHGQFETPIFAATLARPRHGADPARTTSRRPAPCAARCSRPVDTAEPRPAHEAVAIADVYNLTVDGPGEMFVNGILTLQSFDGVTYGLQWKKRTLQRMRVRGV